MEVTQVSVLGEQLFIAREVMLEVLGLHAMRQVDIPADLVLPLDVSDEENGGQPSVSKVLFPHGKLL